MATLALDDIAILQVTDKSSVEHDYARQYERAFAGFRDEPVEVLEIGVADGSSLRMWEQFFTRAKIIGVDIIPGCVNYAGGRKSVEIGSQADPVFLEGLRAKYSPKIIIDDGSHQADHIKLTLQYLFPVLQPGGCYVIEDLHFHRNAEDANRPTGALQLALDLAFATTVSHIDRVKQMEIAGSWIPTIDRVEFVKRAVFIWKKESNKDVSSTIAHMTDLIERSGSWRNWFFFIHYLLNNGGTVEQAEMAARKAVLLSRDISGLPYWRLCEVLEMRGDGPGALAAAEMAISISPNLTGLLPRLERLRQQFNSG